MAEDPTLTAEERAELERLRAENAALRARLDRDRAAAGDAGPPPGPGRVGASAGARSWPPS
jgi:hypothetical protein